jgi:hypothetical protein
MAPNRVLSLASLSRRALHPVLVGDVGEHQHDAGDAAAAVSDRRRAVGYLALIAASGYQDVWFASPTVLPEASTRSTGLPAGSQSRRS